MTALMRRFRQISNLVSRHNPPREYSVRVGHPIANRTGESSQGLCPGGIREPYSVDNRSDCGPSSGSDRSTSGSSAENPTIASALLEASQHQWGRAQRTLEEALRARPGDTDLDSCLSDIRGARRCLRQIARFPRDASLYLEVGRLYLNLELGDDALWAFSEALRLEPNLADAHFFMALEYLYRGEKAAARRSHARAKNLNHSLPDWIEMERFIDRVDTLSSRLGLED